MTESFTYGIHLVRVTTDDRLHQLWVAATPLEEAVSMVLNAIPEGWTATLLDTRLRPGEAAFLKVTPGEIRRVEGMTVHTDDTALEVELGHSFRLRGWV